MLRNVYEKLGYLKKNIKKKFWEFFEKVWYFWKKILKMFLEKTQLFLKSF